MVASTGIFGVGVAADEGSTLHLSRSVLASNHDAGVLAFGSAVSVENTVIRDTDAAKDGMFGRGIDIEPGMTAGAPATLTLTSSVLDGNTSTGIYVGSATATVESTIIRGTRPRPSDNFFGMGIDCELPGGLVTVHSSVVEKNYDTGIFVFGAEGQIEGTVVR